MLKQNKKNTEEQFLKFVFKLLYVIIALLISAGVLVFLLVSGVPEMFQPKPEIAIPDITGDLMKNQEVKSVFWIAPDTAEISNESNAAQINYGRKLISNTSYYLGPLGIVAHQSNGMNCQNCHLDAGTKVFGNNYSAVASTYPKFRERSGGMENIYKRVNDCFERSLNGKALDTLGAEMQAIKAYIVWLGRDVSNGVKPKGSGLAELKFLARAADVEKGKLVYSEKCLSCHGENGEGKMGQNNLVYFYPPLWGEHSFNNGAGLLRLSKFAAFIKSNMPIGASFENPQLTDEQAWDVAAYVCAQVRPVKDLSKDWPEISGKPIDHPFGPYEDSFSEIQHKYGPFGEIAALKKTRSKKNKASR